MYAEERMLFLRAEKDYRLENLTMEVPVAGENDKSGQFFIYQKGRLQQFRQIQHNK